MAYMKNQSVTNGDNHSPTRVDASSYDEWTMDFSDRDRNSSSRSIRDSHAAAFSEVLMEFNRQCQENGRDHHEQSRGLCDLITDIAVPSLHSLSGVKFLGCNIYGSTKNQLSLSGTSDIDISFTLRISEDYDIAATSIEALKAIHLTFLSVEDFKVLDISTRARVPVLKLRHVKTGIELDICINNNYGIQNTELLARYLAVDDRVRPLVMAVKFWAKRRGVNNTKNSTLSSYSWVLLVIHFLQVIDPQVLPVLKTDPSHLDEEVCGGGVDTDNCSPQCLSFLLLGFFQHYCTTHDWGKSSIWFEDCLCRPKGEGDNAWRLCIMDPIEPNRDLGSVITRQEGQEFILEEMKRGAQLLESYLSSSESFVDGEETKGDFCVESVSNSATACWECLCSENLSIPHFPMLCLQCGSVSHLLFECPERQCRACGLRGHISSECTKVICFKCRGNHMLENCPENIGAEDVWGENKLGDVSQYLQTSRCNGTRLIETVLKWSVTQFCDSNLIADRLKQIPKTFDSSSQWFGSFDQFVIEELRSDLQGVVESNLDELDRIPTIEVVSVRKSQLGPFEVSKMTKFELKFVTTSDSDVMKLTSIPCTLCLMVRDCPEKLTLEGLQKISHFLVDIQYPVQSKEEGRLKPADTFNARAWRSESSLSFVAGNGRGWTAVFLHVATISAIRLCDALAAQKAPPFMIDILKGKSICCSDTKDDNPLWRKGTSAEDKDIETILTTLNKSQSEAIESVLSVGSPYIPQIQIIKGPPGTGKTSTLAKLIQCLAICNCRVQAVAPTNVAICELARRYRLILTQSHSNFTRLRKMVILGRQDKLKIEDDSDLADVHFETRVTRLDEALKNYEKERGAFGLMMRGGPSPTFEDFQDNMLKLFKYMETIVRFAPRHFIRVKNHCLSSDVTTAFSNLRSLSENDYNIWRSGDDSFSPDINLQAITLENYLKKFKLKLEGLPMLKLDVLKEANVIFSTVSSAGRDIMGLIHVDVVIVDESTQMVQAETALVLRSVMRCLVLVGDDKQLPATVLSNACKRHGYDESLFSRLVKMRHELSLLNIQYRMHPHISAWPSRAFYEGRITDGPNVLSPAYSKSWHDSFPPLSVYDIREGSEEKHEYGSMFNEAQAKIVRKLVRGLTKLKTSERISVGIVSPYREQVNILAHLDKQAYDNLTVKSGSIDGFQGQEFDVIILTTVRSNDNGNIGFLSDLRRLNVGITRARYALIIVCNVATLSHNITWKNYLDAIGQVQDASNSTIVRDVAQDVAADATRFSELVNDTLSSKVFEQAPWKLIFASDLKISLNKLEVSMRKNVVKRIIDIAYGKWPSRDFTQQEVAIEYQSIIRVYRMQSRRLVWSVDVDRSSCCQRLKFWDVTTEDHLSKSIRKVSSSLRSYSAAYLERCRPQKSLRAWYPRRFEKDDSFEWYVRGPAINAPTTESSSLRMEHRSIKNASLLTKFHDLSSDVARLFASSVNLQNIELPFNMSKEEEKIVRAEESMFILGRSGTGKTTVILHRMYLERMKHKSYTEDIQGQVPLRQLLLTASPILCDAIRRSYTQMCISADTKPSQDEAAQISVDMKQLNSLASDAPVSFAQCGDDVFPLITTYFSFIRMLDKCLNTSFFLKKCFCGMTDREIKSMEVTFERFQSHYYPHFDDNISESVNTIYGEIVSNIKGSIDALRTPKGCLDLQQYESLSDQRGTSISVARREKIYQAFKKYETLKAEKKEYDNLDLVHHVYHCLQKGQYEKFDFCGSVFIDEVQDLTPAELLVLKFVCKNRRGFVFAGDTAQTIAHGVGFRFQTVKDIFYKEIFQNAAELIPEVSQLKENFRTHSGVVGLANSVVELLLRYFPYSIDRLAPESSRVIGPSPIFLDSSDDLVVELFQNGDMKSCDFGAEQVILVRDNATKKDLLEITNKRALILTVVEAKGMEFSDCLVYNFFKTSPLKNDWRVIYEYFQTDTPHPVFDDSRHSALCVELKLLYVVLTRARQNLVIFDGDELHRGPMLDYWRHANLVEFKEFDEDIRNLFLVTSTPQEWAERGFVFWERRQFANARLCYERAGDDYRVLLCEGATLEQQGEQASASNEAESIKIYLQAAELYGGMTDQSLKEAECLEKAKCFDRAAACFMKANEFDVAGRCFEKAKCWLQAVTAYEKGGKWELALRCCDIISDFDRAIYLISQFKDTIPDSKFVDLMDKYHNQGALVCYAKGNQDMVMSYVNNFSTLDTKLQFLEQYDYTDHLIEILLANAMFQPAAETLEKAYKYEEAAKHYQECTMEDCAVRCLLRSARFHLLDNDFVLRAISTLDDSTGVAVTSLIKRVNAMTPSLASDTQQLVALETDLLLNSGDYTVLRDLKRRCSEIGGDTSATGAISMHVLRLLYLHLAESSDNWMEINKVTLELQSTIRTIASGLSKLTLYADLRNLSARELEALQCCLAYFELKLNDSNVFMAKYVEGDASFESFNTLFSGHVMTAPSQGTVRVSITDFAKAALQILGDLYVTSTITCAEIISRHCSGILTDLSWDQCVERKQQTKYNTAERLELMMVWYKMNDPPPSTIQSMSKNQNAARKQSARVALGHLVDIVLPPNIFVDDSTVVEIARRDKYLVDMIRDNEFVRISECGLNYDAIARYLLLSEITNNQIVTKDLKKSIEDAYSKCMGKKNTHQEIQDAIKTDCGTRLAYAFQWECAENETPPSEYPAAIGTFLYSLSAGCTPLMKDFFEGATYRVMYPCNWSKPMIGKPICVSPLNFIRLMEKYVVWFILHMKLGQDVVLPDSLVRDVICRERASYVAAIEHFRALSDPANADREDAREIVKFSMQFLQKWLDGALIILKRISDDRRKTYELWSGKSGITRHEFSTRLVLLYLLYWANRPVDTTTERYFSKEIGRLREAGNCFPEVVWKQFKQFHFQKKNLLKRLSSFYQLYGMTLKCHHWSHNCPELKRYCVNEGIGRAIIDTIDGRRVAVVPQNRDLVGVVEASGITEDGHSGPENYIYEDSAAIPPEVDCFEVRIANNRVFLKGLLQSFRNHKKTRGILFNFQRDLEQRFARRNVDSELWCVQLYVGIMCPFLLKLHALIEKGQSYIESKDKIADIVQIDAARKALSRITSTQATITNVSEGTVDLLNSYRDSSIRKCLPHASNWKEHILEIEKSLRIACASSIDIATWN